MALAIKYYFTFYDLIGTNHKIEILLEGYGGAAIEIEKTGSTPATIATQGDSNKLQTIIGSEITLMLFSTTSFQYEEFITGKNRDYQIKHYFYDGSWTLNWLGWVIPEMYIEPLTSPPYEFQLRALCGLGDLQYYKYESAPGVPEEGQDDLLSIILDCLNEIGNGLGIATAINLFAASHTQTAAYDPLNQTYVNKEAFRIDTDEAATCWDVLDHILKIFGARIILTGGYWVVMSIGDIINDQTFRIFNSAGTYIGNGTFTTNKVTITAPLKSSVAAYEAQAQQIEVIPGYKDFKVTQDYKYRENIVTDGLFAFWSDVNTPKYWTKSAVGTWVRETADGAFMNTNAASTAVAKYLSITPITKHLVTTGNYFLRFSIEGRKTAGTLSAQITITDGTTTYYLGPGTSNSWTTTPGYRTIAVGTALTVYEFDTAVIPLTDSELTIKLLEVVSGTSAGVHWKEIKVEIIPPQDRFTKTSEVLTTIDAEYMYSPPQLELILGSIPALTLYCLEAAYYGLLLDSAGDALGDWNNKGVADPDDLINKLIDIIGDNYAVPTFKLTANIYSDLLTFYTVLKDTINSTDHYFIVSRVAYNIKAAIWSGEWLEIK